MIQFLSKIPFRIFSMMAYFPHLVRTKKIADPQIRKVLQEALDGIKNRSKLDAIEDIRRELLKNTKTIKRRDFGAGSRALTLRKKSIARIARYSLTSQNQCLFLHHLAKKSKSRKVLELGTSFGISTAYLANSHPETQVFTMEGDPEIARMAKEHFSRLNQSNIELITGNFDVNLPELMQKESSFDFVFIDGNHTYSATLHYYHLIKSTLSERAILILDDIYWSKGMNKAWTEIQEFDPNSSYINLYHLGIIFFDSTKPQSLKIWPGHEWILGSLYDWFIALLK
jgi:predicted O-methyltransferase YrrM